MFWAGDPMRLGGKTRTACRSGFLGADSFGNSTLAQIVDACPEDCTSLIGLLARIRMPNGYDRRRANVTTWVGVMLSMRARCAPLSCSCVCSE